jgi:hypothetical protein
MSLDVECLWRLWAELEAEHKGPAAIGLGSMGWQPHDHDPNLHLHLPTARCHEPENHNLNCRNLSDFS